MALRDGANGLRVARGEPEECFRLQLPGGLQGLNDAIAAVVARCLDLQGSFHEQEELSAGLALSDERLPTSQLLKAEARVAGHLQEFRLAQSLEQGKLLQLPVEGRQSCRGCAFDLWVSH